MIVSFSTIVWMSLASALLSALSGAFSDRKVFHLMSQFFLCLSGILGTIVGVSTFAAGSLVVASWNNALFFSSGFVLDSFGAIFYTIVSAITAIVAVYAATYGEASRTTYALRPLNFATGLFVLGMQLVILASTPILFFFAWELMSLSSFFLVMNDRTHQSIHAAVQYLIMTHLGAAAILAGFFLLSSGAVLTSFQQLASAPPISSGVFTLAFVLFLFGFGSKAGLVPFHEWLPQAHPQAPSHISALMSGVMLKVAIYGFLRVCLFLFPSIPASASLAIIGLGLLTALYGVLYAVIDRDIKRTLAFSSIENIGLIFTMIGVSFYAFAHGMEMLANIALLAALFHSISHALFKSGLFMTAGVLVHATHTRDLEKMGGLAKRMPWMSVVFCLLALAAASLPPFGPFFGEWVFIQSLVASLVSASPTVVFVLVVVLSVVALCTGLALFAMVKLFGISMLGEPRSPEAESVHRPSLGLVLPIGLTTALLILLGIFSSQVMYFIDNRWFASGMSLVMTDGTTQIVPWGVLIGMIVAFSVVWIVKHLWAQKRERVYHTWDCGQPVDASMEYTATAFSAPIRFFFRLILRTRKTLTVQPIVSTNAWIAKRTFTLDLRSIWSDYLYQPLGHFFERSSQQMKRIQNGNIQFYLFLLFTTLFVTLAVAL